MTQPLFGRSFGWPELRDRFYNRIMFPINDPQGECIAFGGRVVGKGEPKYLNSQETPLFHKSQVLYGMDKAKAAMASTGIAVVVEDVDNEGLTGRVETDNRMTWAARSADGSFIPQGAVVRIVGQESVKLIVERKVS